MMSLPLAPRRSPPTGLVLAPEPLSLSVLRMTPQRPNCGSLRSPQRPRKQTQEVTPSAEAQDAVETDEDTATLRLR